MLQAVLKSVQVFLLNMCNTLELSGLFVYLRELRCFSVPGDRKNCKGFGLLGGISTQAGYCYARSSSGEVYPEQGGLYYETSFTNQNKVS